MEDTHISFYLKANRIHVFVDALRGIGSPARICFMISEDGRSLLLAPYPKRDFKSHGVPKEVYSGAGGMEVSSMKLCRLIAAIYSWDLERSYRVPGVVRRDQNVVLFDLTKAEDVTREAD
jgi:hypothetical protein